MGSPSPQPAPALSQDTQNTVQGCLFCDLARPEQGQNNNKASYIFENQSVVAFHDIYPSAMEHFLVVPRGHVENYKELQASDMPLVEEMHAVGKRLLSERQPNREHQMGYHMPPFTSMRHLHLHCLALPYVPWYKRIKYVLPYVWMDYTDLEAKLRSKSGVPS